MSALQERDRPPVAPLAGTGGSMGRAFLLVMVAIGLGLGGLYLVRAALLDAGGFTLGFSAAVDQLPLLVGDWRFLAGSVLLVAVLVISLELYGSDELSKVVPLYSLSYVLVALIGQLFLDERVTLARWMGIGAIVTGVLVVVRS
jgi:undecaprenyl phosphate-alpha-L-ara4N flippase subunit ArnE